MKLNLAAVIILSMSVFAAAQTKSEPPPSECPSLSITAPAGVPNPNEPFYYYLDIKGELPKGAEIVWTTSAGQILTGQGTKKIGIYNIDSYEITVSAEVKGLQTDCPKDVVDMTIWDMPAAQQIDEFSNDDLRLDKDAVKHAIEAAQENPDDFLFFVQYYRYDTDKFRVRQLERELNDYLTKELKIKDPFFKFVTKLSDKRLMKIFLVPPGVEDPVP
jgi:hypothetical protein